MLPYFLCFPAGPKTRIPASTHITQFINMHWVGEKARNKKKETERFHPLDPCLEYHFGADGTG